MDLKLLTLDVVANSGIYSPELINLDVLGLYKKITYTKGVVTRDEYYTDYDGVTYSNLIALASFVQAFNGIIYTQETKTVNWYDSAGAVGYTKVFNTTFTTEQSFEFGIRKRMNILAQAKLYALGQLGQTDSEDLFVACTDEVVQYLHGPHTPLTTQIDALVGVKVYLTQPIADGINAILSDI